MVCPVHEPAEVIPLVHAAHDNAIAEADGDAFGEVEVVRDQQRLPFADINDETLVTRAFIVVMQQAADEARDFDPPPVIAFVEFQASSPLPEPS